jgi:hypothetical protein
MMAEPMDFTVVGPDGDGDTWFAQGAVIGFGDDVLNTMAIPQSRPVGGIVTPASQPPDADGMIASTMLSVIMSWQDLATLAGHLRVWREHLPVHLRDQHDARAAAAERQFREALAAAGES